MQDCILTIEFALESTEVAGRYEAKSKVPIFREFDDELSVIGQQLICFLRQAGYSNMNNYYLLMESLTGDEHDAISMFLKKYREEHKDETVVHHA